MLTPIYMESGVSQPTLNVLLFPANYTKLIFLVKYI